MGENKSPGKVADTDKAFSGGGDSSDPQFGKAEPMGTVGKILLGTAFMLLGALIAYMVYVMWPVAKADASGNIPDSVVNLFGYHFGVTAEKRIILLVMVVGALGSYIHAATSFADFTGGRRLVRSWLWWYNLRIFVGLSLALLFYFVIRGGFLSAGDKTADLNTFGVAAISGLAGMFSKQATDKLAELFDILFKTKEERGDKLAHPKPEVSKLDPDSVKQGSDGISLNVLGTDFVEDSIVRFDGNDRETNYVDATHLTVLILKEDAVMPREIAVTVFSPSPGGGTSRTLKLKIVP